MSELELRYFTTLLLQNNAVHIVFVTCSDGFDIAKGWPFGKTPPFPPLVHIVYRWPLKIVLVPLLISPFVKQLCYCILQYLFYFQISQFTICLLSEAQSFKCEFTMKTYDFFDF